MNQNQYFVICQKLVIFLFWTCFKSIIMWMAVACIWQSPPIIRAYSFTEVFVFCFCFTNSSFIIIISDRKGVCMTPFRTSIGIHVIWSKTWFNEIVALIYYIMNRCYGQKPDQREINYQKFLAKYPQLRHAPRV